MDSKQMFATFVFMAMALLPTTIHAIEYTVGDDHGWTDNVDYQAWANDKVFRVGDILGKCTLYIHKYKYMYLWLA